MLHGRWWNDTPSPPPLSLSDSLGGQEGLSILCLLCCFSRCFSLLLFAALAAHAPPTRLASVGFSPRFPFAHFPFTTQPLPCPAALPNHPLFAISICNLRAVRAFFFFVAFFVGIFCARWPKVNPWAVAFLSNFYRSTEVGEGSEWGSAMGGSVKGGKGVGGNLQLGILKLLHDQQQWQVRRQGQRMRSVYASRYAASTHAPCPLQLQPHDCYRQPPIPLLLLQCVSRWIRGERPAQKLALNDDDDDVVGVASSCTGERSNDDSSRRGSTGQVTKYARIKPQILTRESTIILTLVTATLSPRGVEQRVHVDED